MCLNIFLSSLMCKLIHQAQNLPLLLFVDLSNDYEEPKIIYKLSSMTKSQLKTIIIYHL